MLAYSLKKVKRQLDLKQKLVKRTRELQHEMLYNMDKWFKDILPDKDPYHNRGRDQMRKKGGPEFECLWSYMKFCKSR